MIKQVKLNDKVRAECLGGIITTINELDEQGKIEYKEVKMYSSRAKLGYTIQYHANITGTDGYFQISKAAFLSKTSGKKVTDFDEIVINGITITKEALNAFNQKRRLSANEHVNNRDRLGTIEENRILRTISAKLGFEKIEIQMLKHYRELYNK